MQLHQVSNTVFLPQPPPLWYVTDGERSVGPVVTGMLTRGVERGQIPDYCHVRVLRGQWRTLSTVREIAAINSKVGHLPTLSSREIFVEVLQQVGRIKDDDEFLYDLAQIALTTTSAESAMVHCLERSTRAMVTRCVVGPMPSDRLGRPLPERDLVLQSARLGKPVFGPPYGPTEDALAMRFAASRGGAGAVAMIPISVGGVVTTMLELSRPGHAFRRTDLQRAENLLGRALRIRGN
jgi:hypothetical protein